MIGTSYLASYTEPLHPFVLLHARLVNFVDNAMPLAFIYVATYLHQHTSLSGKIIDPIGQPSFAQ